LEDTASGVAEISSFVEYKAESMHRRLRAK